MGHAKKKRDSLFLRDGIYYMSFTDENNIPHRRSTKTSDYELASQRLTKIKRDIYEYGYLGKCKAGFYTFDMMLERFFKEHAPKKSSSMQRSYKTSRAHLENFFSGKKLDKIDPALVLEYQEFRKKENNSKPATRNRELAMLSKAFNLACLWGWTFFNPCRPVSKEKENNEIGRCLTYEEEDKLLDACGDRLKGKLVKMVILNLNTGIRQGEVINLLWEKIDFFNKTFLSFNEKVQRWHTVTMNNTVYEMLLKMSKVRSISGYVFTSANDTPFIARNAYREFKKACREAGLDAESSFRWHDIRHTVGSRLGREGKTALEIAETLDQSQLSTVKRYVKFDTETKRNLTNVLERKKA